MEHHNNLAAYFGRYLKKKPPNTADRTGRPISITNESKKVLSPAGKKYTIGPTIVVATANTMPIFLPTSTSFSSDAFGLIYS